MKHLLLLTMLYTASAYAGFDLQKALDEAKSGSTVVVPAGTYNEPVTIKRGITLKAEAGAILKVEANQPAVLVDAYNDVVIDGLKIQWKLAKEAEEGDLAYALLVRGGEVTVKNCTFEALGNGDQSPSAIVAREKTDVEIRNCRFKGFGFAIQFWNGAEGDVEDCLILNPGHCGITVGHGSKAELKRNIVTGSAYHGIRCTGGEIDAEYNLIIRNRNRGFYIGNRSAIGELKNNLIVDNAIGIHVYGRSRLEIKNNVILRSSHAGLSIIDTAELEIEDNIIAENEQGIVGFSADNREDFSVRIQGRNLVHGNKTETVRVELPSKTITDAPDFKNPDDGSFAASVKGVGLEEPEILKVLWASWQQSLDEE